MSRSILFFLILCLFGCTRKNLTSDIEDDLRWVGDISFNPALDNSDFEICHGDSNVKQYFNFGQGLQYEGEKHKIIEEFKNKYKPVKTDDSGLVRVRFVVNCLGETDRFRIISMDNDYREKEFDTRITSQLLGITKELDGWKILPNIQEPQDYYQYLIFKIDEGNIFEILP